MFPVSDFDFLSNQNKFFLAEFTLKLFEMARNKGVQLILVVGAYEDHLISAKQLTTLTKNNQSRAKFYGEILGVVEKYNLSGVMFQWFYPGCPQVTKKYYWGMRKY